MKKTFTILTAVLMLLAMFANPMRVMGQTTVTQTSFSAISGNVNNDTKVSYAAYKGGGTSNPAANSNAIRLYQNSNGNTGGYVVIGVGSGYVITSATIQSTMATTTGYKLTDSDPGSTTPAKDSFNVNNYSLSANTDYAVGNISTRYITFACFGTTSSSRLYLSKISVVYQDNSGPTPTTYTVTFDAGDGTFVGSEDFPDEENEVEAGTYTLPSATPPTGYTFNKWNIGQYTYDAGDEYEVTGDANFVASYNQETPSGDLTIDFENALSTYSAWTFTNIGTANTAITAHGGSKYGANINDSGNGVSSATIKTVNKIATPQSLTCYVSKTSGNTTTSSWTIDVSENGSTWTNVATQSATSMSKGTWVEFTANLTQYTDVYVRINYSGSNAIRAIDDITLVTTAQTGPSISADPVSILYSATSGSITYTIDNAPTPAGTLTAAIKTGTTPTIANLSFGTVTSSYVPFTCAANTANTTCTATVTLTYTYGNSETVTKDVTITQEAAPYSTIPALFAAATGTETNVLVTFNNWVVSGVSTNGTNVFVTDNNGNGFVIYYSSDMSSTYAAGNILAGTAVSCSLKKYNGFAELLNVNATDLTITTGGTVSTANIAMADLAGVNTGALVSYDNLTCSVSSGKYYLSDGNTTLQVYSSLYDFGPLTDGTTYNITGIYQQFNNTKEILPRSTNDIEEVTHPVIKADNVNIEYFATSGEIAYSIDNPEMGTSLNASTTASWISNITVTSNKVSFDCTTNEGNADRTATFTLTYTDAPDKTVTVTQGHYVDPSTYSTYTLATSIESGKNYIIVGWANGNPYAMGYQKSNNRHAVEISVSDGKATATIANTQTNPHEFTITSLGNGYYSIMDATTEGGYLYAAASDANNLKTENELDENNNGNWAITITAETGVASVAATQSDNRNVMQFNNDNILFACYASASQRPVYFYVKDETPTSYSTIISPYSSATNGWHLIASPVATIPSHVTNMIASVAENYDLYSFDQSVTKQWVNYKAHTSNFNITPGQGYLYASNTQITLTFNGTAYSGNGTFNLVYDGDVQNSTKGWNLMGNPYATAANIGRAYYRMNSTNNGLIAATANENVNAYEGIFVEASAAGQTVTFTTGSKEDKSINDALVINLNRNDKVIDRAIVRFGESEQLSKFQLFEGDTKIYIPQNDGDYAIVSSNGKGTMPVNFKAKEMGMYTISVETEGIDLSYLHLIDRLTGEDVNLLIDSKYSFIASNSDMESRFILSFDENGINANNNETFAFQNGNDIIVNGEGELQIFDVMGRMVKNTTINGVETIAMPQGVYVCKLNGNVQKIVVR